ncbi:DNA-protecting protein DprA [Shimwellia blattae]|uniref:DNA protecting protein DprA n=1 Tax=Shimwellia blattae (strain ATCC 29907 / DSM 4481 / JCM 1650 / NBRC 105725 / CDC 9005-74) TaxID=630626 RepID=I2B4J7_SHIBC|nr:DNA-protecting protein DprA [Shimwellia blattae]AFJ45451.1 DNA protecting protein DprA [Shimwellia blattae DSM 4481 = NBRC 105725]GAB83121.1 Smf protein [Shimwellia blattae DSM 4481 = NBRC 105725]VDY62930.1 DNA protecting protein DprA [Shimwellia blattae]VEC19922.1 DNA protecting protein DprA [Shimwellia blattae]
MELTELWLRLLAVQSLSGAKMLKVVDSVARHAQPLDIALQTVGFSAAQKARFYQYSEQSIERTLCWLAHPDHHLICASDPLYPPRLRAIDWFPGALFVEGDPALLSTPQIAIVGSRQHSWYGERWGRLLSGALAASGITVTSGLALGIDGIAHRGALEVGGKTIAVLGNGLPDYYPRRHQQLARQIYEQGGAVVSELPLGAPPVAANFPRRNRIISGLSLGVLVVEAGIRSGSLVTARYGLEQGRDVFALPGPLGNPGSEGPHWLLKQGAIPVTEPADIYQHLPNEQQRLSLPAESVNYSRNHQVPPLPFPELLANVGDEVTPVDVVAERAGQPVSVTVAQLLELELAGWIAAVPGGYVRLRRACHVRRTNLSV